MRIERQNPNLTGGCLFFEKIKDQQREGGTINYDEKKKIQKIQGDQPPPQVTVKLGWLFGKLAGKKRP